MLEKLTPSPSLKRHGQFNLPATVAVLLFCCCEVSAGSLTATMTVTATVVPSCRSVSAGALSFGAYQSGGAPVFAQSTISISCDQETPYSIRVDGAEGDKRKMKRHAHSLEYAVYRDAGRRQGWGNSPDSAVAGRGTGAPQHHPVYGEILSGQSIPPGDYGDIVTVTLDF